MPMNENVTRDIDPAIDWLTVSNELIPQYAGDHIFMAINKKSEAYDFASDPIWGSLDAVKQNRLYEIDGYSFYFSDPISVMGQIEDIADQLEEQSAE
ncbi:hypothetical protein ACX1C1_03440 [Paenibacillus sp. strain BS8-2]